MTPFLTLRLDHNNQALTKRFVYQGTRRHIWVLQKPKSQATRLKYANGVMTSRIGCHYQPTLWDALKACACPRKLSLLASSFEVKVSLTPK
jgi:predicted HD phosphohydrolase